MPGVPFGRGCEACRKQKKKCDQLQPLCSRCKRLQIECTGSGLQRFKFIKEGKANKSLANHQPNPSRELVVPLQQFSRTLSNETTLLADALIGNLKASDDLRYHLPWSYGGFIEDIPRYIGTNQALDAAVAALLSSLSSLALNQGTDTFVPVEALAKYTRALKTLRITLNDPTMARKTETLCAVMILLICQSFLGTYAGHWSSHGEGAAQILKARGFYTVQDDFERKLLLALRGPVLFTALVDPKISLTSEEWKRLVENELDEATPEGVLMRCLAPAPDIISRGKAALQKQTDLHTLIYDTRHQYQILTSVLVEFHDRLDVIEKLLHERNYPHLPTPLIKAHSHYQRTYGLGLAVCLIYNCILKALDANDTSLNVDSSHFCNEILQLADHSEMYRPLGAGYILVSLIAAWCGCRNTETQLGVERKLHEFRRDYPGSSAERLEADLECAFQRLSLC